MAEGWKGAGTIRVSGVPNELRTAASLPHGCAGVETVQDIAWLARNSPSVSLSLTVDSMNEYQHGPLIAA